MSERWERIYVEVVPAKGDLAPITMSKRMPETSPDPVHKTFYSCILGFRTPPTRLSSLALKAYYSSAKAERFLRTRFSRWDRTFCTLGRWCHKFSFLAFRALLLGKACPEPEYNATFSN